VNEISSIETNNKLDAKCYFFHSKVLELLEEVP
jgi:hypothetical protein